MYKVDSVDSVDTMDKEKKTQDKEMNTCTDTRTGEDTHKRKHSICIINKKIEYKNKKKTVYKCTWEAMCNELSNVYVILLCPILRHYAMRPPAYIYNCVGLYRHTQVYIYYI